MTKQNQQESYQRRLQIFLGQIHSVEHGKRKKDLYAIMDTPVFRDLETALMMATMENEARF